MKQSDWEKELALPHLYRQNNDGEFVPCDQEVVFEIKSIVKSERRAVAEEIITLSDEIESKHETSNDEWRAFKGFRNALVDKYWGSPEEFMKGER